MRGRPILACSLSQENANQAIVRAGTKMSSGCHMICVGAILDSTSSWRPDPNLMHGNLLMWAVDKGGMAEGTSHGLPHGDL